MNLLKQSTAVTIPFGPFVSKDDGLTLLTGLVSALDHVTTGIKLGKNGGTEAVRAATVTASTYNANGDYKVRLAAADVDTIGMLRVIYTDPATCLAVWRDFVVLPAHAYAFLIDAELFPEMEAVIHSTITDIADEITFAFDHVAPALISVGDFVRVIHVDNVDPVITHVKKFRIISVDPDAPAITIDSIPDFTVEVGDTIDIFSTPTSSASSGGGVLNGRIAYSSLTPDEFLEIVQGEEKILTFLVEADGRFVSAIASNISVKIKDSEDNIVTKVNSTITRVTQEEDVQVFRVTLDSDDTNALSAGLLRIEIAFDTQKAVVTHALKVIESL